MRTDGAVVLGHSAGGHLALWLCGRHRVLSGSPLWTPRPFRFGRAVCLAGVSDLAEAFRLRLGDGIVGELMGGSPEELPAGYTGASPAELLPLGIPQERQRQ